MSFSGLPCPEGFSDEEIETKTPKLRTDLSFSSSTNLAYFKPDPSQISTRRKNMPPSLFVLYGLSGLDLLLSLALAKYQEKNDLECYKDIKKMVRFVITRGGRKLKDRETKLSEYTLIMALEGVPTADAKNPAARIPAHCHLTGNSYHSAFACLAGNIGFNEKDEVCYISCKSGDFGKANKFDRLKWLIALLMDKKVSFASSIILENSARPIKRYRVKKENLFALVNDVLPKSNPLRQEIFRANTPALSSFRFFGPQNKMRHSAFMDSKSSSDENSHIVVPLRDSLRVRHRVKRTLKFNALPYPYPKARRMSPEGSYRGDSPSTLARQSENSPPSSPSSDLDGLSEELTPMRLTF